MSTKNIRKWLSEFKTIEEEEWASYGLSIKQNEELLMELYDLFEEDLSPEVIDPVCHQLFNFYRSLQKDLQQFTLEFVPILLWTYIKAVNNEKRKDSKKYGGVETCLLGIYNIEAASKEGQSDVKKLTIPTLARASIYHEPPSLASMALTENALLHYHSDKELSITTGPIPQVESINAQNRLTVLTYILNRYDANISFMSPQSHTTLCKMCSNLSASGFENLESDVNEKCSSGHRKVTILNERRIPLCSGFLIELLSAVYYTMFNGHARIGIQSLEDIHRRAAYELYLDVLLVTNAIRNSLKFNPSGQPMDGPMGISIALSPAQGNPVFAKDAITNASFRAKKLPEDIDVQDHSGQLDTSFHDDTASDADTVLSLRSSDLPEKSKSSPQPKITKGPLKSIMKKKEEKMKDKVHRKESDASGVSTNAARKGSHFKEFLEMHNVKSPKHSVSVSTGLSVSVNGDATDAGAIQINMVRSSSSNRSVFETSTAKDVVRTLQTSSNEGNALLAQDDTNSNTMGCNVTGKALQQQSRALNGTPVVTEKTMNDEDHDIVVDEEENVFTKL